MKGGFWKDTYLSGETAEEALALCDIAGNLEISPIPLEDDMDFSYWCSKYKCHKMRGERRAWCPHINSYLRNAKWMVWYDGDWIAVE